MRDTYYCTQQCAFKMRSLLGVAPYQSEEREYDTDEEDDARNGTTIMGVSYSEDRFVVCLFDITSERTYPHYMY